MPTGTTIIGPLLGLPAEPNLGPSSPESGLPVEQSRGPGSPRPNFPGPGFPGEFAGNYRIGPDSGTTIHTILQCFVDVNLNTDENSTYSTNLPEVSFKKRTYSFIEGQNVEVSISLSSPSVDGNEEVEVGIILNTASLSDFSTLGETYPKSITFSAGQQTHVIKFFANTDLFEEGTESFDVILGFFSNTIPGQYITTTVNIIDQTDLKEVSFNEQGGVLVNGTSSYIDFNVLEGSNKNVRVSLDSPSVLGVETVDVQLTNVTTNASDYNLIGSTSLSWAIGEQHKDITISAAADDNVESDEILRLNLVNSSNVNIASPSEAIVNVIDGSPELLYATVNIQGTYVQYKGVSNQNVEMRWIKTNVSTGNYENPQGQMFLKYGFPIQSSYTNFNTPNGSAQGYGVDAGSNVIIGYDPNLFGNLQHDNAVFFGEKPGINFGVGSNPMTITNAPKQYGDLRLRIKNMGSNPCVINGTTLVVGDSITLVVNSFDFKVNLPTNNGLLLGGTFYNGSPLTQDTLTQCLYDFTFEVDYAEFGFQLRDENNSISSNKEINIGTHLITDVYTQSNSILPANLHNLVTEYNNVWPYWESNFSWPETGPYCIAGATLATQNAGGLYPNSNADLQNIKMNGIAFLHQQLSIQNSTYADKTAYNAFYFQSNGQTTGGCAEVPINYEGGFNSSPPYWMSIPFEVI